MKPSLLMIVFVSPPGSLSTLESGDTPGTWEKLNSLFDHLMLNIEHLEQESPGTGTRKDVEELMSGGKSRDLPGTRNILGVNLSQEGDLPLPAVGSELGAG